MAVQFWYRQSIGHSISSGDITQIDTPLTREGESVVWLDPLGNLIGLQVMPSGKGKLSSSMQPADWSVLFKAAGLDLARYTSVEPDWTYVAYADSRAAWKGSLPDSPDLPMRIEAAAWQGKPVFWRMIVPSLENHPVANPPKSARQAITDLALLLLALLIFIGGAFFARRNLRMGRGDRRGANRLACFLFALNGIVFFCTDHFGSLQQWFVLTLVCWLMYMALEPYVRRRWPDMLIGWSRLLAGDYRDPLVLKPA